MRSSQRAKIPLRLPWVVSLLALAVVSLSAAFVLTRWIRGEECRALLENKVSEAIGGKAEFGPLQWLWVGVGSPRVKAVSQGDGLPHTLEAANVRAHLRISSLLRGFWAVEEISLEKVRLHLTASLSAPARRIAASGKPAAAPDRRPFWIPSVFVVEVMRSGDTDLLFDLPQGKTLELLGSKFEVYPEHGEARLEAHGGKMVWSQFPEFQPGILWARGRMKEGRLRLNGAELSFDGTGSVCLEGEFPDKEGISRMEVHCTAIPLAKIFPSAASSLEGNLSGVGRSSWTPSELRTMEGTVSVSGASVRGVPALDALAAFTGMDQFRHLALSKVSAVFSREGAVTRWRQINLESPGLLRITGAADVGDNGSLSGIFQAGVTTDIVRVIPMARELLSAEEHDGYFWMPVHIAGTLDHPTEDLRPRLLTAVAAKASGMIRGGIETGLRMLGIKPADTVPGSSPDQGTNAAESLRKDAGSVIDALGGFLK